MQSIITNGHLLDSHTIKLDESIPLLTGNIKVVIEIPDQFLSELSFGMAKDTVEIMPGFDEPMEEFQEYQ
jgi:hypothetical protein